MTNALLSIRGLTVTYPGRLPRADDVEAVRGIDVDVARGRVLALVGESGCGKSATASAVMGLLPTSARVGGSITLDGRELVGLSEREMTGLRGDRMGMIFQDPSTYLDPVMTVGRQIAEPLVMHRGMSSAAARRRAVELLDLVGVPDAGRRVAQYPHEFSGGMRQRVMIASALACDPALLIADEPTTALDVTVQAEILQLLRELGQELDSGILLITHDMGVVADLADDVAVMRSGRIVETAPSQRLFSSPEHEYTRLLLDAVPILGASRTTAVTQEVVAEKSSEQVNANPPEEAATRSRVESVAALELDDLTVRYRRRLTAPPFVAVEGVSLRVEPGRVLGLVGESGSGKSTIAKTVVGLTKASSGTVRTDGVDVTRLSGHRLRAVRKQYSIVFQDPAASLNPRRTVRESLTEALQVHGTPRARLEDRVDELLGDVRLDLSYADRYPRELSGGQRQRVSIARALAGEPHLLVADEPTSALDVSVQQTVLELLKRLQSERGFACLFVTHDLAVVEAFADDVAVLRRGRLVEYGPTADVLFSPRSDYTRELIEAAPVPDPERQRRKREMRASRRASGQFAPVDTTD